MTRIFATIVASLIALLVPGRLGSQEMIDRVLAVLDGQVITYSDVQAALQFGLVDPGNAGDPVRAALDALIKRQMMLDEVNRYAAPEPDPLLLEARLATVRARFPSAEAFAAALARTGLSGGTGQPAAAGARADEAALREIVRDNLRIEQYLQERFSAVVQPTGEEIERYYSDHPSEFRRKDAVVPLETARQAIRDGLVRARRDEAIADWLSRLRRRADVRDFYLPPVKK